MKKVISVLLAMLMLFSTCVIGVVAIGDIDKPTNQIIVHSSRSQVPVVRILGDGEPLYNAKQEKIYHIRSMTFNSSSDDDEDSDILSSVANILLPFLIDGLLKDEWDAYYENLQKEISEIFSVVRIGLVFFRIGYDCFGERMLAHFFKRIRYFYKLFRSHEINRHNIGNSWLAACYGSRFIESYYLYSSKLLKG